MCSGWALSSGSAESSAAAAAARSALPCRRHSSAHAAGTGARFASPVTSAAGLLAAAGAAPALLVLLLFCTAPSAFVSLALLPSPLLLGSPLLSAVPLLAGLLPEPACWLAAPLVFAGETPAISIATYQYHDLRPFELTIPLPDVKLGGEACCPQNTSPK